ncbi:cytochrome c biogenesis protein CcsA [Acidobacteriota bacterium]
MNQTKQSSLDRMTGIVKTIASLKLTVICLLVLTLIVIWGTVYQAEHGLYLAQQKFFHSWFFFIFGFIPFPGTVLVLFVLFVNLVASLFSRIGFKLSNIGNIITHTGILVLLVGGFFTFYFSQESTLILKEGETGSMSTSRHLWELAVWEQGSTEVYAVDTAGLSSGETIVFPELAVELRVKKYFGNCEPDTSGTAAGTVDRVFNFSGIQGLKVKRQAKEAADNAAGILFDISPDTAEKRAVLLYGKDDDPTRVPVNNRVLLFSLDRKKIALPLSLTLIDFRVIFYPNSNIPKSYENTVRIKAEGGLEREVVISMNKPLRFKNLAFFQSSYFIARDGSEYTILAVVENVGRLLPYIASLWIFAGMLIHFIVKLVRRKNSRKGETKNKKKGLAALILLAAGIFCCAGSNPVFAEVSSFEYLSRLAIMEEGRVKPLDTFARNILKQFSGQSEFEKKPAIQWLARVLFTPQDSYDDKVFLITNQEVLDSIGVQRVGKARNRYSYSQLRQGQSKLRELAVAASKIDNKRRSFIESEIIALFNKIYVYQQLMAGFDFLLPHPDFAIENSETREYLELPDEKKDLSYFDLLEKKEKIWQLLHPLQDKKPGEWTAVEKETAALSEKLGNRAKLYGELPLAIIPAAVKTVEEEKWLHPWSLASSALIGRGMPVPRELVLLRDFVRAYRQHNQESFDRALQDFNRLTGNKSGGSIRLKALSSEVFYNRLDPFYKAKFFYGFSVLFLLLTFLIFKKWFYRLSFILLFAGFSLQLFGVLARIYIRLRPPVTNLYETFIFTGLITVLLGMILEFFKKRNIGILTGSLAGLVMLMIAGKYAMEGDTMGMLVAVLDSNFWLASHVITIILGYAGIVLSGFIGHVYILQAIFTPQKKDLLKNTFQAVYSIQAFGIIFTFIGTVLGGIWADQSWGRFWGWDPKENGALVILLWSAILFHAKLAGWIKEAGMTFGSVIGVIAVSLAWFGVNLLGVGLHSYGFTSGIARSLFIFIVCELLFITAGLIAMTVRKMQLKVQR